MGPSRVSQMALNKTDRLVLRPWVHDDIPILVKLMDWDVLKFMMCPYPLTHDALEKRLKGDGRVRFVITTPKDGAIGMISWYEPRESCQAPRSNAGLLPR